MADHNAASYFNIGHLTTLLIYDKLCYNTFYKIIRWCKARKKRKASKTKKPECTDILILL